MLLFSWLLDLSALRQGKAISLAPCIVTCVTCTGGILTEEHIASPVLFSANLNYNVTVLDQEDI